MSGENERLFSPNWYRVAELKPLLRRHVAIHRHVYRDRVWYVLQDGISSRLHRFTPSANVFIGMMDGKRSVEQIWSGTCELLGDDAPTQDQIVELLSRLHEADLLQSQARPDADAADRRRQKAERARMGQKFKNPLSLRIALLDPDRQLEFLQPLGQLLFSRAAALVWLLIVLTGLAVAASNATDIAAHAGARAFTSQNLLLIALVFPLMKLLHELGHALAVKRWGGQVHEVGLMFLVLAPLPYVDASGAAAFRDKYKRIAVSAAGIAVELGLAALAVILWAQLQPGLVRDLCLNVMLIGAVSTVVFNGNPLLRFDAYYMLADALEIPNLAQRARRYLGYLLLRHLFGVRSASSPVTATGEAFWFTLYGIAASLYRILVAVTIIGFVAGKFFVLGTVLAVIAVVQMLVLPLFKQVLFLLRSPLLSRRRSFALGLSGVIALGCAIVVFFAPLPLATQAEGVVWLPEDARVRSQSAGFVRPSQVQAGSQVRAGQVLFELEEPLRTAQIQVLEAQIEELQVQQAVEAFNDQVKAEIIGQQIASAQAELERERELSGRLLVRSPADGLLVFPDGIDPTGQFVEQGQELALVIDRAGLNVRVVIAQTDVALVRDRLSGIQIRLADRLHEVLPAQLLREVPAANYLLPSKVLGVQGGGRIPVEPGDERGLKTMRKVFQLELALPDQTPDLAVGQRVYVRLGHGAEPIAWQLGRRLQQVFLWGFGSRV